MTGTKAPILQTINKMKRFKSILRSTLPPESFETLISSSNFHIQEKCICEYTGNGNRFSENFFDEMFPHFPPDRPLFHYTSISSLTSIASSYELHLFSIEKRIDQAEIKSFAKDHGLKGYLDTSNGNPPFYKELAKDLFYTSFTESEQSDPDLWSLFGEKGHGIRLKVLIKPTQCELRSIQYKKKTRTLLSQLNRELADQHLPPFCPWTISKIGAFYLPSDLKSENEVRLLIKRHAGGRDDSRNNGQYEYWPLPLQNSDICNIQVQEIMAGPKVNLSDVKQAVKGTELAHVIITPHPTSRS